jgi:hypothetical protein
MKKLPSGQLVLRQISNQAAHKQKSILTHLEPIAVAEKVSVIPIMYSGGPGLKSLLRGWLSTTNFSSVPQENSGIVP